MAFNPLHMFRKRQKTLLACVAIMCMFLFILQFGKGDIFERLGIGKGSKDDTVLKQPDGERFEMFGKKVTSTDLYKLRHERRLGVSFILGAYQSAGAKIAEELAALNKLDGLNEETERKKRDLQQKQRELQARTYQVLESSSTQLDDLLDFMIWRDEAKKLGLYLTDQDIEKLLKDSTFDKADLDDARTIALRSLERSEQDRSTSIAEFYEAARDDICARRAKLALLGPPDNRLARMFGMDTGEEKPGVVIPSPYDRYQEFLKNRSSNYVALMAVPVKDFVDKVEEKPDEAQLRQLFDRYKNQKYSPDSKKPGFMEPQRVSLEWVSSRADSPHYRELAYNLLLGVVAATPVDPLPSVGLVNAILKEYKRQTEDKFRQFASVTNESPFQMTPLTDPNIALSFYTSLNKAENVAPVIGMMALGNPLSAVVSYQSCPVARDQEKQKDFVKRESDKRAAVACGFVLNSLDPNRLAAPAFWTGVASQRQYLPMDVVGPLLLKKIELNVAQELLVRNLDKFKKELDAKRYKPKDEVRKWLEEAVKEYGLAKHVIVSKPLGQYEIADDPDMKPFKDYYLQRNGSRDPKVEQFAALFFDERAGKSSVFSPKEWPPFSLNTDSIGVEEEPFIFWKTEEDKQPREMTFEAAREKVVEAWRFQKARALAKKFADELHAKAREKDGSIQSLKDLAKENNLELTELSDVARLAPRDVGVGMGIMYRPYEFPKGTIPNSGPQTLSKILDELLSLKKKGDVVVFANQPEDHFYVAALYERLDRDAPSFYMVYKDSSLPAKMKDQLFDELDAQRRETLRQELLKQLRSKVAPVDDNGAYRIDPDQKADLEKRLKPGN
jgi:hypothetical protein